MTVTHSPAGFTGTVDQVDEARRFALGGGGRFRVSSSTDWVPTANSSTNRTVNISAGMGEACGVVDITTASDSVTFAANGGGTDRFDAVVATFDWSAGTVSFRVVQGTTVIPTIVRTGTTVDAAKINWLPGIRYDAVVAIIRVRPSVTILAPADLYDCRPYGSWARLSVAKADYKDAIDVDLGVRIRDVSNSRVWEFNGTTYDPVLRTIGGTVNADFSAVSFAIPTVTWAAFSQIVTVTATMGSGNSYSTYCEVDSVTTSGMSIVARSGVNLTASIPVFWSASGY